MISKGNKSKNPYINLNNLTQLDIASYYLNVKTIPSLIHSPLRKDSNPSFALYCPSGTEVNYKDFSTGDSGNIWTLLTKMWNCSISEAAAIVYRDLGNNPYNTNAKVSNYMTRYGKITSHIDLQCKVRDWKNYDLEYWSSYGISLKWLKYADVYPISHKIIIKDNISYTFKADKYAYAYVEFKERKTTLKIYQPFNKNGFKWSNGHDKSVISMWTKIPKHGDRVCICSSLKDALCLWSNLGIPALAVQGEGYTMSDTAINELKRRYKKIFISFDTDKAGIQDGKKLAEHTGFTNIIPDLGTEKDFSDYYKSLKDKEQFKQLKKLFI